MQQDSHSNSPSLFVKRKLTVDLTSYSIGGPSSSSSTTAKGSFGLFPVYCVSSITYESTSQLTMTGMFFIRMLNIP